MCLLSTSVFAFGLEIAQCNRKKHSFDYMDIYVCRALTLLNSNLYLKNLQCLIFFYSKMYICKFPSLYIWLLLLLSRFTFVRLCVTPQMAAHQAPPSLGFFRQEHWSGLPFPSPMHESGKWKLKVKLLSKCPTLRDPMDYSLPGRYM